MCIFLSDINTVKLKGDVSCTEEASIAVQPEGDDTDYVSEPDSAIEKTARQKEIDNDVYNIIESNFLRVPEKKQVECFFAVRRLIRNIRENRLKN